MAPTGAPLSPAMLRCLADMREAEDQDRFEDAEIVCEGIQCWLGERQISRRTVNGLLSLVLVREEASQQVQHYTLNECGRAVLRRPELAGEIEAALHAGTAFTVTADNRLQFIG